jgi:hypothetical protein
MILLTNSEFSLLAAFLSAPQRVADARPVAGAIASAQPGSV